MTILASGYRRLFGGVVVKGNERLGGRRGSLHLRDVRNLV